jgi:hypothetical protein
LFWKNATSKSRRGGWGGSWKFNCEIGYFVGEFSEKGSFCVKYQNSESFQNVLWNFAFSRYTLKCLVRLNQNSLFSWSLHKTRKRITFFCFSFQKDKICEHVKNTDQQQHSPS